MRPEGIGGGGRLGRCHAALCVDGGERPRLLHGGAGVLGSHV